jgi:hypothetical protein
MGQAETPLKTDRRAESERLQREIAALRSDLGAAVEDLEHRGRELVNVPLQVRRHGVVLAVGLGVVTIGLAAAVSYAIARRERSKRPVARMRRVRTAAQRFVAHPERIGREDPPLLNRLIYAALTAVAGASARKLVERAVRPLPEGARREVVVVEGAPSARH